MSDRPEFHEKTLRVIAFIAESRAISQVVAGYALVQGLLILLGGTERFSAPGYRAALQVPGAPAVWGVVILLAGMILIAGKAMRRNRVASVGAGIASVWSFLFGVAFFRSAMAFPDANLTAIATYAKDGLIFMIISVGLLIHNPRSVMRP